MEKHWERLLEISLNKGIMGGLKNRPFFIKKVLTISYKWDIITSSRKNIGLSPSGKAQDFDSCIHWFESNKPS